VTEAKYRRRKEQLRDEVLTPFGQDMHREGVQEGRVLDEKARSGSDCPLALV
jgi:hypothetical protein